MHRGKVWVNQMVIWHQHLEDFLGATIKVSASLTHCLISFPGHLRWSRNEEKCHGNPGRKNPETQTASKHCLCQRLSTKMILSPHGQKEVADLPIWWLLWVDGVFCSLGRFYLGKSFHPLASQQRNASSRNDQNRKNGKPANSRASQTLYSWHFGREKSVARAPLHTVGCLAESRSLLIFSAGSLDQHGLEPLIF